MLATVGLYFAERGWPVAQHDSLPVLRMEYEGDHGRWPCYAKIDEARQQLSVLSLLPDLVVPEQRRQVAEFLARANYLLPLGSFDMDFSDGEIRFRATIDVSQATLTAGLIDPLVKANWVVVDEHIRALRAVATGEATPEDAINEIIRDSGDVDFDFTR